MRVPSTSRWRWFWRIAPIVLILDIAFWAYYSGEDAGLLSSFWVAVLTPSTNMHYVIPGATVLDSNGTITVVANEDIPAKSQVSDMRSFLLMHPRPRTVGLVAPGLTKENYSLRIHNPISPPLPAAELAIVRT